jgi:aspartyl-tRNA(Asn)/glutamyl-tRNA(Gln) amidotransferase subunit A
MNQLLDEVDVLLLPGSGSFAPLIEDVKNNKNFFTIADDALKLANFAGTPSITIPLKNTHLP